MSSLESLNMHGSLENTGACKGSVEVGRQGQPWSWDQVKETQQKALVRGS